MAIKRISRFGIMQTAKVAAVMYFILSFIIILPFIGIFSMIPIDSMYPYWPEFNFSSILIIPFVYAIIGFIMTAIACAFYNLISGFVGGIEVEVEDEI